MAVPNKGALTLNTPKVSDSKRSPDGASAAFICTQMDFNDAAAQAANGPKLWQWSVYIFTPLPLSQSSFMCEGYEAKCIKRY